MSLLHNKKYRSQYSRIELFDKGESNPPETPYYPSSVSNDADVQVFFDLHGVVASCQEDVNIDVKVYAEEISPQNASMILIKSGIISVGGLICRF
jgi:hypothetical protein